MRLMLVALALMLSTLFAQAELETAKGAKQDIEALKKEMSAKLGEVEKEIEELRTRVKTKGDQALEKTIKELEEKRTTIRAEVDSLKQDARTNLKTLRKKLAEALDSIHEKAKKALQD
ncbi:MAG: hypothetical protein IPK68_20295 [Bdellovibrionales bacterium]|nr:hypothetical protein [Bdellovibrionales bacterium]